MKKNLSWIAAITDRSGSMSSIANDAIGGFNAFVEAQRSVPGEAYLSLVLFDDRYETPYELLNIKEVPELTAKTFVPRGTTALLDAIGRTIIHLGAAIDRLSENDKPEHVIVVILTDGEENASSEFSSSKIKEMITHQTNVYNWQFIYIAANVDTFSNAQRYGINPNNSHSFVANRVGTQMAYAAMNESVTSLRATVSNTADPDWIVEPVSDN